MKNYDSSLFCCGQRKNGNLVMKLVLLCVHVINIGVAIYFAVIGLNTVTVYACGNAPIILLIIGTIDVAISLVGLCGTAIEKFILFVGYKWPYFGLLILIDIFGATVFYILLAVGALEIVISTIVLIKAVIENYAVVLCFGMVLLSSVNCILLVIWPYVPITCGTLSVRETVIKNGNNEISSVNT